MTTPMKLLLAAGTLAATFGLAAPAQAGVSWSIGINAPIGPGVALGTVISGGRGGYAVLPVYSPSPVVYEPEPVYAPPPVVYEPPVYAPPIIAAPVYYGPPAVVYAPARPYYGPTYRPNYRPYYRPYASYYRPPVVRPPVYRPVLRAAAVIRPGHPDWHRDHDGRDRGHHYPPVAQARGGRGDRDVR
jgi:hypothetical protein